MTISNTKYDFMELNNICDFMEPAVSMVVELIARKVIADKYR